MKTPKVDLVLRTVYLPMRLDRVLKRMAFTDGVTKNEIIRRLLAEAVEARAQAGYRDVGQQLEARRKHLDEA